METGDAAVVQGTIVAHGKCTGFLFGIERTLRERGTLIQRVLCAAMMALLSMAQLPGGGYCCQSAMFAVLLRQGFCVPAAFAGVMMGFAGQYTAGTLAGCWQLPVCTLLWLSAGVWANPAGCTTMAVAEFIIQLTAIAVTGIGNIYAMTINVLTAAAGAGLSILYDGAALSVSRRDELDGDTRPLCILAVCASLVVGMSSFSGGRILAAAMATYLTLEHAYIGGAQQAILCAGIMGGVVSLIQGNPQTLAMLLIGGFLVGEIKTSKKSITLLLMLCGMTAGTALMGGDLAAIQRMIYALPGVLPFLVLSRIQRSGMTYLIEQDESEEMTQSEAVAVRSAAMIHSWAKLYEDTAKMMEGLGASRDENPVIEQCIDLLQKTSAAAHQVCERTLGEIHPDDKAYKRIRYTLAKAGIEEVHVVYALKLSGKMEVMLLKPEVLAPATLVRLVSSACGVPMRSCARDGLLGTQAVFEQAPAMTLDVGAAVRSRSGEDVAGDSYVSRALPGGRHVLALSDGMGSGVSARQESHAALSLMIESLRAGYTRTQAIDVVNALMLMCTGREMYATMDLCVCDLHSGETAFEKLGACASYIMRDGEVRTIGADTLPVGVLPDVESRSFRMTMQVGDVIIMMTDGVRDAYPGGETALHEDIAKLAWLHPQIIGEKLIARAVSAGEVDDDMAVLCARISKTVIE